MATLGTKLARMPELEKLQPTFAVAPSQKVLRRSPDFFRLRLYLLVLADLCCVVSGAVLAIMLRFHGSNADPFGISIDKHVGIAVLYSALIVLFCHTQKLYTAYQSSSWSSELAAIVKSVLMATVLLGCTLFITGIKSTSRLIVASTAVSSVVTMTAWRQLRRRSLHKAEADGLSCHNVLIVGTDNLACAVAQYLAVHRQFGLLVVGHVLVASSSAKSDLFELSASEDEPGFKTLGSVGQLKTLCRSHFIDEVLVCGQDRQTVMQVVADSREAGVGVRVIPDLYDGLAWGARLDYLGDIPSLAVVHRATPALAMMLKRLLDVFLSALALAVLGPLLLLLSAIVKIDSDGPILYSSKRVGKKGRVFSCLKFRTMVLDAESLKSKLEHLNERDGVLFKITNDPRITRVGRFLRKHSLDELPQLWNVLRGDMSLVGPRPPLASEVKNYQLDYLRRLNVAPGITGLWQVEARNNPSFDKYISLDLSYVENWSLSLDLSILLRTVAVVLAGTGS